MIKLALLQFKLGAVENNLNFLLRQETLFHDPDTFRLGYKIKYFLTKILEFDFLGKNCEPLIANLYTHLIL